MGKKKLVRNLDFLVIIIITLIVIYSLIMISSATYDGEGSRISSLVKQQIFWFIAGLGVMSLTLVFDYHILGKMSKFIYIIIVMSLVAVELYGDSRGGAQRWIEIGGFTLQPSEFAKLGIIITLAWLLSKREDKLNSFISLIPALLHVGIPMALVLIQPDLGTSLVFVVILMSMLFMAGVKFKVLISLIGAGVAAIPPMWFFVLGDYQRNRILTLFNPYSDPLGTGYNVIQSIIAVGSGQLTGRGLYGGSQSQLNFVPEQHTDFIFTVVGEELGFIGSIVLLFLYLVLILRLLGIARKAKDLFGSLVVTGIVSVLMFQIFENIGMTMGIMPVTGIPLPFMSYGGSSLLMNMISVGIALNIGMRRQKTKFL
ncbi:MAG: rod shape-determining protein RodA [Mahellales bacterium]|jgi:rod shape determining protein RodA